MEEKKSTYKERILEITKRSEKRRSEIEFRFYGITKGLLSIFFILLSIMLIIIGVFTIIKGSEIYKDYPLQIFVTLGVVLLFILVLGILCFRARCDLNHINKYFDASWNAQDMIAQVFTKTVFDILIDYEDIDSTKLLFKKNKLSPIKSYLTYGVIDELNRVNPVYGRIYLLRRKSILDLSEIFNGIFFVLTGALFVGFIGLLLYILAFESKTDAMFSSISIAIILFLFSILILLRVVGDLRISKFFLDCSKIFKKA